MSENEIIEAERAGGQSLGATREGPPEAAREEGEGGTAAAEAAAQPDLEAMKRQLEELRQKADSYFEELLRARAETENLRKRTAREVEAARKYGYERFVAEMLPVKDSLELGVSAAATATDVAALREGMDLTLKAFNAAFTKLGVTEIDPAGEKFDPQVHQAISVQQAEAEPGTVLTVVQRGYKLNDRLLRPALVIVAGTGPSEWGARVPALPAAERGPCGRCLGEAQGDRAARRA